jgi:hypothetical protein
MKKLFTIITILLVSTICFAQNTNCWYSSDYVLMGDKWNKKGLIHSKNKKGYVCFNDNSLSFFTQETGLVTFTYVTTWSGVDSNFHNQVKWEGMSDNSYPAWMIKMTYNDKIWINNNSGWTVQFMKISHTQQGQRKFKTKK